MERSYLTLKQTAEVLKISENELLEVVKNKQIPFEITDEGTVYEAYRFIEKDVLKAFKPRETEEEETVKEPKPEKTTEEEAKPEPEEPAEQPQPEQPSEKTEDEGKDPFEEAKKEKQKKDKTKK